MNRQADLVLNSNPIVNVNSVQDRLHGFLQRVFSKKSDFFLGRIEVSSWHFRIYCRYLYIFHWRCGTTLTVCKNALFFIRWPSFPPTGNISVKLNLKCSCVIEKYSSLQQWFQLTLGVFVTVIYAWNIKYKYHTSDATVSTWNILMS